MKPIPTSLVSRYGARLMRIYRWIWLGRIEPRSPEIPRGSLVLAAHYNGLVDAFVYGSQLSSFIGVISTQWHRSFVGRWLMPGIAVKRAKDRGSSTNNLTAFRLMVSQVQAGERLLFFPEGTSRLGPERLPIGRGTLLLLRGLRSGERHPAVFFTAIHYHQPTRWRSNVSLGWVGPVALPDSFEQDESWVQSHLLQAQSAAYSLPVRPSYRWTWLAALFALPYLPVWAVTMRVARHMADEENVISLWKFIFGVPVTLITWCVFTAVAAWSGLPWWIPSASLTGGWLLWNR
jgi:1-acyl-sn-glycerol-3-phosphate acyltransferase